MRPKSLAFLLFACLLCPCFVCSSQTLAKSPESPFLSQVRQLTFEGRRAGEGYFNADGNKLVFQSEREPGNPFFQIYELDMETGETQRISTGLGKTTCAWASPDGQKILFASTHQDSTSRKQQQAELEFRASGKTKRYSWDYDPQYELFSFDRTSGELQQLTENRGYDAECAYSPDGQWIVFASNRNAYSRPLSAEEKELFEHDPAVMMDLYVMRADGTEVKQLTETLGYDGGPFFSADGKRICWRRFSTNGASAEIYSMAIDGTDVIQHTSMGVMSWAPYYHPSGEYLIFATNRHGFDNFELYMVATHGKSDPIRVTEADGFDGLPAFSPDGKQLTWTCNRTSTKQSQLFLANWDHQLAREVLDIQDQPFSNADVQSLANQATAQSSAKYTAAEVARHVHYLCRPEFGGRLTGTFGEQMAGVYIQTCFEDYGLKPAGEKGTFFDEFEFTSGVVLGEKNNLILNGEAVRLDTDWRPVSFSASGSFEQASVVFAGYGIVAPEVDEQEEYDSYVHLDVQDKWVMVFRYLPDQITPERRQHLSRYSGLRYKAMMARDRGAKGMIVVSGPNSKVNDELVELRMEGSLSGSSIPVLSMTDEMANKLVAGTEMDFQSLQSKLDTGDPVMGVALPKASVSASIDVQGRKKVGRNVLARLQWNETPSEEVILVGAHYDHLGVGRNSSSLAKEDEKDGTHVGADDNASGVAAMLEIAEALSKTRQSSTAPAHRRDIIFAAWSGEELGLLGSASFAKQRIEEITQAYMQAHHHGHHHAPATDTTKKPSHSTEPAHEEKEPAKQPAVQRSLLATEIVAALNLDMVGRFDKKLILQGTGSSTDWPSLIEQRNVPVGLPITMQSDSYLPTDASTFYLKGIPILSAFTGSHPEYHTPRDTPEKLNYEATAQIARLMGLITNALSSRAEAINYTFQKRTEEDRPRVNLRAYLGTIPDYAEGDLKGVKISGVTPEAPAAKAGLKGGDVIIELAGRKIDNIYDYTYAIDALKIGEQTTIKVRRGMQVHTLDLVPGSRD